jgi:membrane associated rhomboid family serine protease
MTDTKTTEQNSLTTGWNANSFIRIANHLIYWFVQTPQIAPPFETTTSLHGSTTLLYNYLGKWCPCVGPTPFYAMTAITSTTLQAGQYWKLLTATFLHGGLLHLWGNMYYLKKYGNSVIQHVGNAKFLLIYFISGTVASCVSCFFLSPHLVGLGASGAIYGIMMASGVTSNAIIEGGRNSATAWCLCFLATEGILAYTALHGTKYDETLQLIALGAWIDMRRFYIIEYTLILSPFPFPLSTVIIAILVHYLSKYTNSELKSTMYWHIGSVFVGLFFDDNTDHWAHLAGGLTGLILASGAIIGTMPGFDGGLLAPSDMVRM